MLVEGSTLLREALRAGLLPRLVAATADSAQEASREGLLAAAAAAGARLVGLRDRQLEGVTDAASPTGLVAAVQAPARWSPAWPAAGRVLVPVLWGLQDPGNVGMLLRSALAFGASGCLLGPGSADALGPKCLRASAGAAFHLPLGELADTEALATLARQTRTELRIASPAPAGAGRPGVLPDRCLLVLGHETRGTPRDLVAESVSVPHREQVESLNVGVAGAILMSGWYAEGLR